MAYRIKRKEGLGKGVRRLVREQLEGAIRTARDRQRAQEDRVHEVRTRLKRSRAALKLIRHRAGGRAKRAERRLRDAGRRLSRPRDLAVQAQTFRALGSTLLPDLPARLQTRLLAAEQQLRRSLQPKKIERALRRAARDLRRVRRRLGGCKVTRGRQAVGQGIDETYRAGLAALAAAEQRPSQRRLHEWRKQVKALWLELRIVREAVPELGTTLVPKVGQLAELLGQIHDLDSVGVTVERNPRWFGRAADAALVLAAIEERRTELEAVALQLARSVFAGRPRDVRALVETGWRIWRSAPSSDPEPAVGPLAVSAIGS